MTHNDTDTPALVLGIGAFIDGIYRGDLIKSMKKKSYRIKNADYPCKEPNDEHRNITEEENGHEDDNDRDIAVPHDPYKKHERDHGVLEIPNSNPRITTSRRGSRDRVPRTIIVDPGWRNKLEDESMDCSVPSPSYVSNMMFWNIPAVFSRGEEESSISALDILPQSLLIQVPSACPKEVYREPEVVRPLEEAPAARLENKGHAAIGGSNDPTAPEEASTGTPTAHSPTKNDENTVSATTTSDDAGTVQLRVLRQAQSNVVEVVLDEVRYIHDKLTSKHVVVTTENTDGDPDHAKSQLDFGIECQEIEVDELLPSQSRTFDYDKEEEAYDDGTTTTTTAGSDVTSDATVDVNEVKDFDIGKNELSSIGGAANNSQKQLRGRLTTKFKAVKANGKNKFSNFLKKMKKEKNG